MVRVFKRLLKASKTQASGRKVLGWETRLRRLEEALLEANALQVRQISEACKAGSREPTSAESDFLGAAEDYRKHLTSVLAVNAKETYGE